MLSLKFVGFKANFTCTDGVERGKNACQAYWGNGTTTKCSNFSFDDSLFSNTIVQRWNLVCDDDWVSNLSQTVFFAGCFVGVLFSGNLADR